jgi:hypothetical protein
VILWLRWQRNPDAIVVPKIETAEQVKWVSERIESYELSSNLNIGAIRLLIGVETAKEFSISRRSLKQINGLKPSSSVRRITRHPWARRARRKRPKCCMHAQQLSRPVQRMICRQLTWSILTSAILMDCALKRSREQGLGFSGQTSHSPRIKYQWRRKRSLHPISAIEYAKRIVESFKSSQKEGKGAYALDGKMIDMPLLKNAQKFWNGQRLRGKYNHRTQKNLVKNLGATICFRYSMASHLPFRGAREILQVVSQAEKLAHTAPFFTPIFSACLC